ncbi:lanthionine synthetase C family protein [Streptomyces fildesensis]|uniref:Lanthionine synthetase C family protein n=1 Tax=Streptomyces fildesensis TaxID=375757 RepID=A0ABW8C0U6_9ACTN
MQLIDTTINGKIVGRIAEQLADPDAVRSRMLRRGEFIDMGDGTRKRRWDPVSLANGYPGVVLLFSELGYQDNYFRGISHRYLGQALAELSPGGRQGLYGGLTAVAFATRAAARTATDYAAVLTRLDGLIEIYARRIVHAERAHLGRPWGGTAFAAYDVLSGLTGIGRYFLAAGAQKTETFSQILEYLVDISLPVFSDGLEVPGWTVRHPAYIASGDTDGEHVNFGASHGIAGPLALLSLAWQQGAQVPGHEEAIRRISDWFVAWRGRDGHGTFWPTTLSRSAYESGDRGRTAYRPSWCYGSPAIARALQLAGMALGEPGWLKTAAEALGAAVSRLTSEEDLTEVGLCHGLAGFLHTASTIHAAAGPHAGEEQVDAIAAKIVGAYVPEAPFSFRVNTVGVETGLDCPGFLEGSAGVALALLAHSQGAPPETGWDRALLLA